MSNLLSDLSVLQLYCTDAESFHQTCPECQSTNIIICYNRLSSPKIVNFIKNEDFSILQRRPQKMLLNSGYVVFTIFIDYNSILFIESFLHVVSRFQLCLYKRLNAPRTSFVSCTSASELVCSLLYLLDRFHIVKSKLSAAMLLNVTFAQNLHR